MENATKALLIAASVLIAIVLIAVGIKILSSTQGVTNEVDKVSDATSKAVFNSQFTDYEGTQTGTQVKALLNKAVATYRNGTTRTVVVNYSLNNATDIANYRAKNIKINQQYQVVVYDTDGDGFVDNIVITTSYY